VTHTSQLLFSWNSSTLFKSHATSTYVAGC